MTYFAEGFEYKDGVWKGAWHTTNGQELKVLVIGDSEFMNSESAPVQQQTLINKIDEYIDRAANFACESEYRDDIAVAGGIVVDSIVVNQWDDIKIWFTLRDSGRMVGVRINQAKAVDVFCDH